MQAEVLVTDDADDFKTAADENGLKHQVCKKHVLNNSEAWHDTMQPELARDTDGSLAAIGVAPEQALADNDELLRLMQERQPTPEANAKLARSTTAMHRRARFESSAWSMRLWLTACACSVWIIGTSSNV